jgi:hypothetical protein
MLRKQVSDPQKGARFVLYWDAIVERVLWELDRVTDVLAAHSAPVIEAVSEPQRCSM